jgi:anti-sigma regulatory factor (Ser/Thr protein kinase)
MLGETRAVELLKAGAWDYVLKDRLARLGPAVARALTEAAEASARRRLQTEREAALDELRRSDHQLRAALTQLQGLQELTAALGGALTERDVVAALDKITFPLIGAAAGGLALTDGDEHRLRVYRWTATDGPGPQAWSSGDVNPPMLPLAAASRQNQAMFFPDADAATPVFPDWSPRPRGEASAFLPLGRAYQFGVLALVWPDAREFPDTERLFLLTVAAQCTQAIDRTWLFRSQTNVAQALQRALLPPELPELPGLRSVARYLPAHGDAVGGDWYDLLRLPGGTVALVMGDVEGHSAVAAAIMGQVSSVLRAYVADRYTPAEIMNRLNQFVTAHTDRLITCCYAELDPPSRILTIVSAGHPMPVVMDPDGHAHQLQAEPGLPLGVRATARYTERTIVLPAGGRLIMFTDGLVDERAVYQGMDKFLQHLTSLPRKEPDELADALVARPDTAPPLPDDAALLILQLPATVPGQTPNPIASRTFRLTPAATPACRHFVLDVLDAWQMHDVQDTAGLVVSELVTNAVLHTAGDVQLTLRGLGEGRIWIGVRDNSDRLPQPRQAADEDISGRGLAIIDLVSDEWGVDLDADGGKTVWLHLPRQERTPSPAESGREGRRPCTQRVPGL